MNVPVWHILYENGIIIEMRVKHRPTDEARMWARCWGSYTMERRTKSNLFDLGEGVQVMYQEDWFPHTKQLSLFKGD